MLITTLQAHLSCWNTTGKRFHFCLFSNGDNTLLTSPAKPSSTLNDIVNMQWLRETSGWTGTGFLCNVHKWFFSSGVRVVWVCSSRQTFATPARYRRPSGSLSISRHGWGCLFLCPLGMTMIMMVDGATFCPQGIRVRIWVY
jgi:hypothetical protein